MSATAPRSFMAIPAVRALLAQAGAFPLTVMAVWVLARVGMPMDWQVVALVQGTIAALVAWTLRLAVWWRAIEFIFPLGVVLARGMAVPPGVFLGLFLVFLLVYWSTFRTQVPYYPSGKRVWNTVAEVVPADRACKVIDVGSGLGGLVLDLAARRPDCEVSGIELAPLPWLASRLRTVFGRSRAHFLLGNYESLNFGHYDVVFAYLSPAAMEALWRKAEAEMRPGSMLLSYEFDIPGRLPDRRFVTTDSKKILYLWDF
jgi:hypothetical protein